jgi:hypothetical protein
MAFHTASIRVIRLDVPSSELMKAFSDTLSHRIPAEPADMAKKGL